MSRSPASHAPPVGHSGLDPAACEAYDACGQVCLLAALARCLWCQAPMHVIADSHDRPCYACRPTGLHAVAVDDVDAHAWQLHLATAAPVMSAVTDSRMRRQIMRRAYAAAVIDPERDALNSVFQLYPRPQLDVAP